MEIFTEIIGNIHSPIWKKRLQEVEAEWIELDRWTAQKSRLAVSGDRGGDYHIALKRHTRLLDGDILLYDAAQQRLVGVRIDLGEVLLIEFDPHALLSEEERLERTFELGHAIGNQHWPAVIKHHRIYLPLVVDRKVMERVLETHHIEGFRYTFRPGEEVIPFLSPHELRRLFGGSAPREDEATDSTHPAHSMPQ